MPKWKSIIAICLLLLSAAAPGEAIPGAAGDAGNAAISPNRPISLTQAEKTWIAQHTPIRVGMAPVVPPLKFVDNGIIKGIEADYLKLIEESSGVKFEFVVAGLSELDDKVKAAEVDMFISYYIPERLSYMTFTEPLMDVKQLIITRDDAPFIGGIGSLRGKKIATIKGVRLNDKLLAPFPDIERVEVDSVEQQFHAVAESRADALIVRTYSVGYLINKYPELKVAGFVEQPPEPLMYAIRKDYTPLVGILNKAINAIPSEQHDAIMQKWCSVRVEKQSVWPHLRKWVLCLGGVFSLFLGFTIFWNRRLVKEIDKRNQAEESLRNSNVYLESLINHANAPIIVWDANFCITRINHAFEQMTGRNEADVLGKSVEIIFPEDHAAASMESIKKASTGERMETVEIQIQHLDGSLRTVLWNSATIYAPDGRTPVATIAQGHDITFRKQVEEEKLTLEHQLQESMRWESIGLLAGGIAHDFNNILAVIIGHSGILRLHPERLDKSIPEIEKAAERAADLCQQMLAYAGKAPAMISRVDMFDLVTEIVRMLQPNLPKNINVETVASHNISRFDADANQIRQVVMNLIMNSVEAIGEKPGEIRISVAEKQVCER
ncbi:MAG: transporter substrate-binding domain-containing protein, partial [Geobacter sp.]|nr:transporter substrate-binding domain-containing protein [Geobacter sp.]